MKIVADAARRFLGGILGRRTWCLFFNPKTLELCVVTKTGDTDRRIFLWGDEEDDNIGHAYTAERHPVLDDYRRIHSPSALASQSRGKAYGLLLYCGTAITATLHDQSLYGVFSIPGDRSAMADKLWNSMVRTKVAEEDYTQEEDREEEENVCFDIPDRARERDDGGFVRDSEVCGDVTVVYPGGEEEINLLKSATAMKQDFFLATSDPEVEGDGAPPADLAVRVRLTPTMEKSERLRRVQIYAQFLEAAYGDDAARAFTQRPDVLEVFGQERLPGVGHLGRGSYRKLPPLSRRSKILLHRFQDAE